MGLIGVWIPCADWWQIPIVLHQALGTAQGLRLLARLRLGKVHQRHSQQLRQLAVQALNQQGRCHS